MATTSSDFNSINLTNFAQTLKANGMDFVSVPVKPQALNINSVGIPETLDVVDLTCNLVKAVFDIGGSRLTNWMAVVMSIPAAFAGYENIPTEFSYIEAQPGLLDQIFARVKADFPTLSDEHISNMIAYALKWVFYGYAIVSEYKAHIDEQRAAAEAALKKAAEPLAVETPYKDVTKESALNAENTAKVPPQNTVSGIKDIEPEPDKNGVTLDNAAKAPPEDTVGRTKDLPPEENIKGIDPGSKTTPN